MQRSWISGFCLIAFTLGGWSAAGADLKQLPGYDRYVQVRDAVAALRSEGRVSGLEWNPDGNSLQFLRGGKRHVIQFADFTISEVPAEPKAKPAGAARPGRARQSTWVRSPNGRWIARYRNDNVVLEPVPEPAPDAPDQSGEAKVPAKQPDPELVLVTSGGTPHLKYGTACWVYGEELFQNAAMWWSPDSRKLAFYEMDEQHLQDYYLTVDNTELYTKIESERYPKAGRDNPVAGLLIYDLETRHTTRLDLGEDRTQYVYDIQFRPDGSELLYHRTNRRQDVLELMAADPVTGRSRVVLTERQATWQENRPLLRFLADGERFIWETERSGWKQYELRHLDGRLLHPLSPEAAYPVESLLRADEQAGWLYYTAFSGENPNNAQLHRVRLDGTQPLRLTSSPLNHTRIDIAPNHQWFVVCREAVDTPPQTVLCDQAGKEVAVLAEANVTRIQELRLPGGELFSFPAADDQTQLYGILHKPANFDPNRKYPLVVSVYGGPASRGIRNTYRPADPYCEFGFLIATIANRGTTGRGKAFETATYQRLGDVDLRDQADGVRFLGGRPYVDAARVGIFGHSYGGYMSALALLKYPDLFHVGVAGAPVTDWKNYDTIYTERYMRTPQENPDGYRDSSCLTHARNLKGKLLLLHGLIDDNVHPANTWQLADRLLGEDVPFDMKIYPRSRHGLGANSNTVRWEYLVQHLVPR